MRINITMQPDQLMSPVYLTKSYTILFRGCLRSHLTVSGKWVRPSLLITDVASVSDKELSEFV